jgi:hypothetical protein
MPRGFWWGKLRERNYMDVYGRTILNINIK